MKTFAITIEKSRYDNFIDTFDKMNRRCVKLNIPQIVLTEGDVWTKKTWIDDFKCKTCVMQDMTITAPDIKLNDEWNLVGSVECGSTKINDITLNMVSSFSDNENLSEFAIGKHTCFHCMKDMNRNKLFVIKNSITNERKLVGSSCVKDFIGHDLASALFIAGLTHESFYPMIDEEKAETSLRLDFVIQNSLGAIISQNGFYYSKKSVREGKRDSCTCDLVINNIVLLFNPSNYETPFNFESDVIKEDTQKILSEMEQLVNKITELESDFERNIAIIRNNSVVPEKYISYVVGFVGTWWTRNKGPTKNENDIFYYDPLKSEYLGSVGDKIEIFIAVEKVVESNSSFGGYLIFGHQMMTNNRFMLYSSKVNELFTVEYNDRHDIDIKWKDKNIYKIRATIKSVSDNEKYGKSTMLSRGKILPIELPKELQ